MILLCVATGVTRIEKKVRKFVDMLEMPLFLNFYLRSSGKTLNFQRRKYWSINLFYFLKFKILIYNLLSKTYQNFLIVTKNKNLDNKDAYNINKLVQCMYFSKLTEHVLGLWLVSEDCRSDAVIIEIHNHHPLHTVGTLQWAEYICHCLGKKKQSNEYIKTITSLSLSEKIHWKYQIP